MEVGEIIDDPVVLPVLVIENQGADKLIKWTTTVEISRLPSQ